MIEAKNQQYLQVLRIFQSLTDEELQEFICELNVDEKRLEPIIENVYGLPKKMKTAEEIIKILATRDPITQINRHEQLWDVCYYCEQVQHYAVPLRHGPDCLWPEMKQITQENK